MRELKLRPVQADDSITKANEAHAKSLGLRKVSFSTPHQYKLAVVGGGPSAVRHWDEIKRFDAVLAINATHKTLSALGIDSTFVSVDPDPVIAEFAKGARSAIVASRCAPEVFAALRLADVRIFDAPGDVRMGTSTASTCVDLAAKMGFRRTVFFGCELCFMGPSHADRDEDRASMVVHADGKDWITAPDFYLQAQELSGIIRANPGVFGERSGGMLRAMVRDKNYRATKAAKSLIGEAA